MKYFCLFVIVLSNACNMSSKNTNYITYPIRIDGKDFSITPELNFFMEGDKNLFEVALRVTRLPDQEPLYSEFFELKLFGNNKRELKVVNKPKGMLTEVGGSLGTTVNFIGE